MASRSRWREAPAPAGAPRCVELSCPAPLWATGACAALPPPCRSWIAAMTSPLRIRPVPLMPMVWAICCNSGSSIAARPLPVRRDLPCADRDAGSAPSSPARTCVFAVAAAALPAFGASAASTVPCELVRNSVVSLTRDPSRGGRRLPRRPVGPVSRPGYCARPKILHLSAICTLSRCGATAHRRNRGPIAVARAPGRIQMRRLASVLGSVNPGHPSAPPDPPSPLDPPGRLQSTRAWRRIERPKRQRSATVLKRLRGPGNKELTSTCSRRGASGAVPSLTPRELTAFPQSCPCFTEESNGPARSGQHDLRGPSPVSPSGAGQRAASPVRLAPVQRALYRSFPCRPCLAPVRRLAPGGTDWMVAPCLSTSRGLTCHCVTRLSHY